MRVCVGGPSRFHIFDLARQLNRLSMLQSIYTGYPPWKVGGLPRGAIKSFPWLISPMMLSARFGLRAAQKFLQRPAVLSFDSWMSSVLGVCDVFHCLSGFGIKTHHAAKKKYGALTVCDRASSHIRYQQYLLEEEYARWGLGPPDFDSLMVERELLEYDACDVITVPSSFAYRSFIQQGVPASKLIKIPFGVDLQMFKPTRKRDDVFRVIYVGAVSARKGIPYLLQALDSLHLPHFEAWIIGGIEENIKPLIARLGPNCRYFGVVKRELLADYYSQGSVFVLASVEEGLAFVQAQAMACGLPVIATTNTGGEDLFTDGREGFIVPIRQPEAIRDRILLLYEDQKLQQQMSRAAIARVNGMGGWDSYGTQVAQLYRQQLQNKPTN